MSESEIFDMDSALLFARSKPTYNMTISSRLVVEMADEIERLIAELEKYIKESASNLALMFNEGHLHNLTKEKLTAVTAECDELAAVVDHFNGFISESDGISGWHQNGNIVTWDELGLDNYLDAKAMLAKRDLESESRGIKKALKNVKWEIDNSYHYRNLDDYANQLTKQAEDLTND
jgi:hypothetical protein